MKKTLIATLFLVPCLHGSQAQTLLPYQNPEYTAEQRAEDLLSRLTLEEKVVLMQDNSQAIPRLGIRQYSWWNEALHGAARSGLATVFPQTIGMASSFDPELLLEVYTAVSDEARAKYADFSSKGERGRYQCLTFWTPNINIFRDPRWGRGMETYGEDPYLTTQMGLAVVEGLQGPRNSRYDKLHACAKHFAVHSGPEWNRHSFNAQNVDQRDLYETYLPAFKALVQKGDVKEVMCAYNRYEDEPCCGSNKLLQMILREDWGFKHLVVSDCGAISDFYNEKAHHTHPDASSAAAAAVIAGTDVECGSNYKNLKQAAKKGLISEEKINTSVRRLLTARFALGEMDPDSLVEWNHIPYSVVASDKHNALAKKIALESIVLLQNNNNILPLTMNGKIAVMGPNANDSVMQWANYNGTPRHTSTILGGILEASQGKVDVIYEPMCGKVERTVQQSAFNLCSIDGKTGFTASYWNNMEQQGKPVVENRQNTPFHFCTLGAIVFAPGVELNRFSAQYKSQLRPNENGEVNLSIYYAGKVKVSINGEVVKELKSNHGGRQTNLPLKVEAGKSYDIQLDYIEHLGSFGQLDFDICYEKPIDFKKSIEKIKDRDIVVFVGGLAPTLEGEEMSVKYEGFKKGDRTEIELPAVQREAIKALHDAGKKVIYINCSGSAVALVPESENSQAIIQAWYPGQAGGEAVADILFGKYNPSGKLPVTFYRNLSQLPDFEDYSMKGRTYRYLQEKPLFAFGYGLSYTTFSYGKASLCDAKGNILEKNQIANGKDMKIRIPVSNTGNADGCETVQVYIRKKSDSKDAPFKTLRAFARKDIGKGATETVEITLQPSAFEFFDWKSLEVKTLNGEYVIYYGESSQDEKLQSIEVKLI